MTKLIWLNACCRKQGCPEVAVDEVGQIHIKDDYGGVVQLTSDELDGILYTLATLAMEKESQECCGGHCACVHTFTDEEGVEDYEKMLEDI